ncbi:hypothetical protein Hanom_Chr17g01539461 [Helianthus anomalus]
MISHLLFLYFSLTKFILAALSWYRQMGICAPNTLFDPNGVLNNRKTRTKSYIRIHIIRRLND